MKENRSNKFWVIGVVVLFSCQKSPDLTPPPLPPDTTPIEYKTKIGAFVTNKPGDLTPAFQSMVMDSLHTKYMRNTIVMENWTGQNKEYEYFTGLGFKTLLNIHNTAATKDDPSFYTKDTVAYKLLLDEILTKYSPEVVLIENEPGNFQKHKGPVQDYLNQLRAAMTIVHKHGLKGADGGFSTRPITFLVYRYYYNRGEYAKADDFANRCIPRKYMFNLANPGRDEKFEKDINKWDSLIQGYKNIPLDYVTVHLYEPIRYRGEDDASALSQFISTPTPGAFQEISDYILAETGKPMICNEMGQLNLDSALVSGMQKVCNQVKMPYVIWFSGDWGIDNSYALNELDGIIRSNGIAFRNFNDAHPQ